VCESRGRSRRRGTSRLHAECGAHCRAQSHDLEIMTLTTKSQTLNSLSHPGAPNLSILKSADWHLNSPLPCNVTYSRVIGTGVWASSAGHYSAQYRE